MRPKDKEYEQARELRVRGYSLREICRLVPASKSTISVWIRDIPLSQEQLERLNDNRAIGREKARATVIQNREKRISYIHNQAEVEYKHLKHDPTFMFGLALYIGEGFKGTKPEIGIVNWNCQVVCKGLEFFAQIGISKAQVRCKVTLHPSQDRAAAEAFWSEKLGIPLTQFTQTYQAISPGSRGKRGQKWPHGGCTIKAYSIAHRHKLNKWMEMALAESDESTPSSPR